ncbi:tankyrase [Acrasis kona]|uniref:Tankyrase n=1 Tax=Acrasis kona TaxID=1008807 RepID=A0AAW2Z9Y0_9EUKA
MSTGADALLYYAVQQGDVQQSSTLIVEANADVNATNGNGTSCCHVAAMAGNVSILELLLSYEVNPNLVEKKECGGQTPLHVAVNKGYKKVCETLLNHLADPNVQDAQGFTPLHIAARKGLTEIAKLIISKGANVDIKDNQGKTAAYWAKEYRHDDITSILPAFKYDWLEQNKKTRGKIVKVVELEPPKTEKKVVKKKVAKKK